MPFFENSAGKDIFVDIQRIYELYPMAKASMKRLKLLSAVLFALYTIFIDRPKKQHAIIVGLPNRSIVIMFINR
jgi:hypothetical protein